MIIKKDINPERSLYYLGSLIIRELKSSKETKSDFLEVYRNLKHKESISMNSYMLTLDWLFLNEIVEFESGMIKKCF